MSKEDSPISTAFPSRDEEKRRKVLVDCDKENHEQRPVTRSSLRKKEAKIKFQEFDTALKQAVRFSVSEQRNVQYRHLIGSIPKPSDQQQKKSCYAHAVGKALVKIFDGPWSMSYPDGFDIDQDEIIKTLENKVGTDPKPYGAFNNIPLTVRAFIKGQPENFKDIDIRILSEVDINALGGVTPRMTTEDLNAQHMAIVLTMSRGHAMYVDKYDPAKQEYHAINSWGQLMDPTPVVPIADVDSLDYIQIKEASVSSKPQPLSDRTVLKVSDRTNVERLRRKRKRQQEF